MDQKGFHLTFDKVAKLEIFLDVCRILDKMGKFGENCAPKML